jgi:hypothetical protein
VYEVVDAAADLVGLAAVAAAVVVVVAAAAV